MSNTNLDGQLRRMFGMQLEFTKGITEFLQYLITRRSDFKEKKELEYMLGVVIKDKDAISVLEVVNLPKEELDRFAKEYELDMFATFENALDKSSTVIIPSEHRSDLDSFVEQYNQRIGEQEKVETPPEETKASVEEVLFPEAEIELELTEEVDLDEQLDNPELIEEELDTDLLEEDLDDLNYDALLPEEIEEEQEKEIELTEEVEGKELMESQEVDKAESNETELEPTLSEENVDGLDYDALLPEENKIHEIEDDISAVEPDDLDKIIDKNVMLEENDSHNTVDFSDYETDLNKTIHTEQNSIDKIDQVESKEDVLNDVSLMNDDTLVENETKTVASYEGYNHNYETKRADEIHQGSHTDTTGTSNSADNSFTHEPAKNDSKSIYNDTTNSAYRNEVGSQSNAPISSSREFKGSEDTNRNQTQDTPEVSVGTKLFGETKTSSPDKDNLLGSNNHKDSEKETEFKKRTIGTGYNIPVPQTSEQNSTQSSIGVPPIANKETSSSTTAKAEVFEMKLKHSTLSGFKNKIIKSIEEQVSNQKDNFKETASYKGIKENKTHYGIISSKTSKTGLNASLEDMGRRMAKMDSRGDFKYLNAVLKENKYLEKDAFLKFGNKKETIASGDIIVKMLADKKIVLVDGRGNIDAKIFKKLSNEEFAKLMKIKDLTQASIVKENFDKFLRQYEKVNNSLVRLKHGGRKYFAGLMKNYSKDNATFNAANSFTSYIRTVKQTYKAGKALTIIIPETFKNSRWYKRRETKREVKYAGNPRYEKKKLAKEIKNEKQSAKALRKREKINLKKNKKEKLHRQVKHSIKKVPPVKYARKGIYKAKSGIKKVTRKIPYPIRRFTKRIGGVASSILKSPFKAINLLGGFLNKIKVTILWWAAIGFILLLILQACIVLVATPVIMIFGFLEDQNINETSFGKTYNHLISEESDWANTLKDIGVGNKPNITEFKYTSSFLPISSYASKIGTVYEESTSSVLGPVPFPNAPFDAIKRIQRIDGGNELSFENKNNTSGGTSNIKEILSMTAVFYDQNVEKIDDDLSQESLSADLKNMKRNIDLLKANATLTNTLGQMSFATISRNVMTGWDSTDFLKMYATSLFYASHQEEMELKLLLLPTKYSISRNPSLGNATENDYEVLSSNVSTVCPEENGCTTYHDFYFKDSRDKIYTKGNDGSFTEVTDSVYASRSTFGKIESCVASTVEEFRDVMGSLTGQYNRCWDVTIVLTNTKVGSIDLGKTKAEKLKDLANLHWFTPSISKAFSSTESSNLNTVIMNSFNSNGITPYGSLSAIQRNQDNSYTFTVNVDKEFLQKKSENEKRIYYDIMQKKAQITFTHNCKGGHSGSYCGGHLVANVKGIVLGFSQEELNNKPSFTVNKAEYKEKISTLKESTGSQFSIDKNALKNAKSLFEIDAFITRDAQLPNWNSWTKSNISWAISLYDQDWEDLYGIVTSSAIGGKPFSKVEINEKIKEIEETYSKRFGDLSEKRKEALQKAFFYVGRVGYDQRFHGTILPEIDQYTSNLVLFSDCSGFASNIWYNDLKAVYSTGSFYSSFKVRKFTDGNCKPGDILLHYEGKIGDHNGDHALIYAGWDEYGKHYSIDCTTVNDVGQVRYASRNYYNNCYYIPME